MNIKEKIGQRIQAERKAKGFTQAGLAELAGNLKQPRINHWEKGIRTPGHEEIRTLAKILEVSPSYLMCLTERKHQHPLDKEYVGGLVPLFTHLQAYDFKYWLENIRSEDCEQEIFFIPISLELKKEITSNAFALKVIDESMKPELQLNDVLIINPDLSPKPGDFVIATIDGSEEVIIRRYKQLSISNREHEFALLALNDHWPEIKSSYVKECRLLGTVIYLSRQLTRY